jgi:hypothetical protein
VTTDAQVRALPPDAVVCVLKQNQANESVVDITPSKNILLKAGTSDYNLPCAVAELIDNSIQALRFTEQSHRRIQVRLEKRGNDTDPLGPLYIWDNGCGMTFEELKRWATMGISQMDMPPPPPPPGGGARGGATGDGGGGDDGSGHVHSGGQSDPRVDSTVVTGQISRFGVGAKRAAFFLGRRIKVSTKSARSADVCETELSEEALNRYGEQEWKITVKQRPPKSNETDVSFTSIKVDQMNALPYTQADTEAVIKLLRRDLGRIYYYYTHERVGDFYSIRVGPERLNANNDDMQTLYTKFGHNTEVFEYDLPIPKSFRPPSGVGDEAAADDLRSGTTRIVAHARYFPFENDDESLPVPYEVLRHLRLPDDGQPVSSAQVPLVARKPGVEIYWNGRLIPEAHLPQLGFMTLGQINNTQLEEQWRNRVRVTAFVGSVFPVTHNKMHLVHETPIVNALMDFTTRSLTQQFRTWLLKCHRELDQEVTPVGARFDARRNVTVCDEVRRGDLAVSAGSKVVVKAVPSRLGRVKEVFFRGAPDRRSSEVMVVIEPYTHAKLDDETWPATKVKEVLTDAQWNKALSEQQTKLPSKIKCIGGDDSNDKERIVSSLVAGAVLPWVNVHVLDATGKLVVPTLASKLELEVHVEVRHVATDTVVDARKTHTMYKTGRYSIEKVGGFARAGAYRLQVWCTDKDQLINVPRYTHTITVSAGAPSKLMVRVVGSGERECEALLGGTLPQLEVCAVDACDNETPWPAGAADASLRLRCSAVTAKAPSLAIKYAPVAGARVLRDVNIAGAAFGAASCDADGHVMYRVDASGVGDLACEPLSLRVRAGAPARLELLPSAPRVPPPFALSADDAAMPSIEVGSPLEAPVCVRAFDQWNNAVPQCEILIRSEALDSGTSTAALTDASGTARIGGILLRRVRDFVAAPSIVLVVEARARVGDEAPAVTLAIYARAMPSRRPARVRVTAVLDDGTEVCDVDAPDGELCRAEWRGRADVEALRATWRATLLDDAGAPCTALPRKARLEASWGSRVRSLNPSHYVEARVDLPAIKLVPGDNAHWLTLTPQDPAGEPITLRFEVRVPTPPAESLLLELRDYAANAKLAEVQCGHELRLRVRARDGFDRLSDMPPAGGPPEEFFEVVVDPSTLNVVMVGVPTFDAAAQAYDMTVVIGGRAGDATIVVKPNRTERLSHEPFRDLRGDKRALKLTPGVPQAIVLRADGEMVGGEGGQPQLTVDVDNGSRLAGFAATVVDEHGNNVHASDVPLYVHCATLHIDVAAGVATTNQHGEALFGRLLVQSDTVPSSHQLVVSTKPASGVQTRKRGGAAGAGRARSRRHTDAGADEGRAPLDLSNVAVAHVIVQVQAGRVPATLELLDGSGAPIGDELELPSGTQRLARLRVRVIAENGDVLGVADVPAESLSLTIDKVAVDCTMSYEAQALTHSFADVPLPHLAGVHELLVECVANNADRTLQARVSLRLLAGPCVQIGIAGWRYLPSIEREPPRNTVVGLVGHEFEHGMRLVCRDAHDNVVPLGGANETDEFALEFRVEPLAGASTAAAAPLPQLEGETRVLIEANGTALVRSLSVAPSSFVVGCWHLVARAVRRSRDGVVGQAWRAWVGVAPWSAELMLKDAANQLQQQRDARLELNRSRFAEAQSKLSAATEQRSRIASQLTRARLSSHHVSADVVRAYGATAGAIAQVRALIDAEPRAPTDQFGCVLLNGVPVPRLRDLPSLEQGGSTAELLAAVVALNDSVGAAMERGGGGGGGESARAPKLRVNKLNDTVMREATRRDDRGGVLGTVGNLFFCDDPAEARALAALLASAQTTMVVRTADNAMQWREWLKAVEGRVELMALDLCPFDAADSENVEDEVWGERRLALGAPPRDAVGFVDYAVNRLTVRVAHARLLLRRRLANHFLGRAMLFDTMANAVAFRKRAMLAEPNRRVPTIGVLESGEILSAGGSIAVGRDARTDMALGSTPRSETAASRRLSAVFDAASELIGALEQVDIAQQAQRGAGANMAPTAQELAQQLAEAMILENNARDAFNEIESELAADGGDGISRERRPAKRAGAPTTAATINDDEAENATAENSTAVAATTTTTTAAATAATAQAKRARRSLV